MAASSIRRKLIDIGVNLTDPMFKGIYNSSQKHVPDLTDVMTRAIANGVEKMIVTGGSLEDSKLAIEIAKSNDILYSTVGCHPTRCLEFDAEGDDGNGPDSYISEMIQLVNDNKDKVIAIGECGLDYERINFCPKETQLKYFERQIDIAESTRLPMFLHCRGAANDLINILGKNRERFSSGVVHSFDGTIEEAMKFINMGLNIGINGCSLKTETNLDVVSKLPNDRIMIETDSPWCEIKQSHASAKYVKTIFQSKKKEKHELGFHVKGRNEPANLVQILEVLSAVRNENIEDLADSLYENTIKLFFS